MRTTPRIAFVLLTLAINATTTAATAAPTTILPFTEGPIHLPFVQTDDPRIAARINDWIFLETLERPAPRTISERLRLSADALRQSPEVSYAVVRNDARLLTLQIDGEWCGAYCETYRRDYNFDVASGRPVTADDLLTPAGLIALNQQIQNARIGRVKAHIAKLRQAVKAPKPASAAATADGLDREDMQEAIAMYTSCLATQADLAKDEKPGHELRRNDLSVSDKGLRFTGGRCSNHASRALDELGDPEDLIPMAQASPLLSAYGQALLLGSGSAPLPPSPWHRILQGRIGDKLPITMRLELDDDGSVRGDYFYDAHRKLIPLYGRQDGAVVTLDETPDDDNAAPAKMILRVQGERFEGTWQGQQTLPLTAGP